ncbi:MAG: response regulator [Rectinemataceae bacterium]
MCRGGEAREADLILLDIRLAGEADGIDAAREIRSFDAEIDIIFMSGYQEAELRERAMAHRPLAFLVKPVLLKDIQSIMERPR